MEKYLFSTYTRLIFELNYDMNSFSLCMIQMLFSFLNVHLYANRSVESHYSMDTRHVPTTSLHFLSPGINSGSPNVTLT